MIKYIPILLITLLFSCNTKKYKKPIKFEKSAILEFINENQDSLHEKHKIGYVFFAIDTECPLCISYSKTMMKLYNTYKEDLKFYAFLPSPIFSNEKTNVFIKKYHFNMPLIVDTNQIITSFLDAKITPECFLLDNDLNILYQGLIDNWIKELGRKGQNIDAEYLNEAIIAYLLNDTIMIQNTNAIGCIIERFK